MATLLVAVFTLPGLLIYFLLRPQETLAQRYERDLAEEALLHDLDERHACPNCQHQVETDFVVCPYCHHQLRLRCVGCGRLLRPNWDVCPYCGLYRDQDEPQEPIDSENEVDALPLADAEQVSDDITDIEGSLEVSNEHAELVTPEGEQTWMEPSDSAPSTESDSGPETTTG
jgi:RNA polymerase subunit RPABC4/transcription elongation factor Spt4